MHITEVADSYHVIICASRAMPALLWLIYVNILTLHSTQHYTPLHTTHWHGLSYVRPHHIKHPKSYFTALWLCRHSSYDSVHLTSPHITSHTSHITHMSYVSHHITCLTHHLTPHMASTSRHHISHSYHYHICRP